MSTPSIQTLITQAQQVLNLKSSNEIRATLAAVLANANVGTPLNPNLTTQQLWDEFYEIVRQPSDDIMSIITDQMMRMVFSPPAPGGAGADKQVIFNDGGVLAGDTKFLWDKTANRLDVDGPVVITGDLTVQTTGLILNTSGLGVGITPTSFGGGYGTIQVSGSTGAGIRMGSPTNPSFIYSDASFLNINTSTNIPHRFFVNNLLQYTIEQLGVFTWADGAGGTRMTLNSTGLGVGASPSTRLHISNTGDVYARIATTSISKAGVQLSANGAIRSHLLYDDNAGTTYLTTAGSFGGSNQTLALQSGVGSSILFQTNGTLTAVGSFDTSGNLLLGTVTSPTGTKVGAIAKLSTVSLEGTAQITVSTTAVALSRVSGLGGLFFVQGYADGSGVQAWWLVAANNVTTAVISSGNTTGLVPTFTIVSGQLKMVLASGTFYATSFNITA
jgi:hypothetical protein